MEAALSHAYEQLLACQGSLVDHDDGCAKRQSRTVCTVAESSNASETAPPAGMWTNCKRHWLKQ